ncbi:MAG: ABC transporter permease [Chloroflexi bacterium]|nr:ABC transporter permease [Chloroflexota bacterium]
MSLVTRRNLLAEKTRFAISIGGIALSVFLISFLLSLFQGWQQSVGRFVERVEADVWVAREGTTDFLNAASILPASMLDELLVIEGVADVDAMIVRPMNLEIGEKQEPAHLIGYEVDGGAGGPPAIAKGEEVPGPDGIILEKTYAKVAGLGVGDSLVASGRTLEVVGISTGGDFVFSQTVFVSLDTARDMLSMNELNTFYLLHLEPDAAPEEVAAEVEQAFEGVSAFTGDEFAEATRDRIMSNIVPILFVILFLAFVVGVAITGLTIYNATLEKSREFGILKATGFTNAYLYRLVAEQSLITGLLGFLIGAGSTVVATRFIADFVPQFVTLLRWQDIVLVFVATLLMSAIAAVMPVRRIAGVDPVAVFKA